MNGGCVMAVWVASPVSQVASVQLTRWRVHETVRGDRHFAEHNVMPGTGRVSTAIVSYDPQVRRGRTASGRVYELVGAPAAAADPDAEYVWAAWCVLNRIVGYRDVTDEYEVGKPSSPPLHGLQAGSAP